jgi:hypothetical protein
VFGVVDGVDSQVWLDGFSKTGTQNSIGAYLGTGSAVVNGTIGYSNGGSLAGAWLSVIAVFKPG